MPAREGLIADENAFAVLILAAGKGIRMGEGAPKVLRNLLGRPLLDWVLGAVEPLRPQPLVVVAGHGREAVQAAFRSRKVSWAVQEHPRGTGHAVWCARETFQGYAGDVLVLYGDVPLIRTETLGMLAARHREGGGPATLLTANYPDPTGLGRILRGPDGGFCAIVEEKHATADQKRIREANTGLGCFRASDLFRDLPAVDPGPGAREWYLTDLPGVWAGRGMRIGTVVAPDASDFAGVNTPKELAAAERLLEARRGR